MSERGRRSSANPEERIRRDLNLALGCAAAVALLVSIALIAYLWTL